MPGTTLFNSFYQTEIEGHLLNKSKVYLYMSDGDNLELPREKLVDLLYILIRTKESVKLEYNIKYILKIINVHNLGIDGYRRNKEYRRI